MAFNEMTEGQDLNLILSRRFGVQGAPAPNVASELFPVVVMDALDPAWGFLAGRRFYSTTRGQAAVVGEFQTIYLKNPAGSGIIITCHAVVIDAGDTVAFGFSSLTPAAELKADARDSRIAGPVTPLNRSTGSLGNSSQAGTALLDVLGRYNSAGWPDLAAGVVLGPGGQLAFEPISANAGITASVVWSERRASSDELRNALSTV